MITEAEYNRYSISVKDFEKAVAFLQEAEKHQIGSLVHEALSFAAIVCYFRPFTSNEKDPSAAASSQLSLSEFQPLSLDEQVVHDQCKELRNKALAHAEFKYYPTRFDTTTGVTASTLFSLTRYAPDLRQLSALAQNWLINAITREPTMLLPIVRSNISVEGTVCKRRFACRRESSPDLIDTGLLSQQLFIRRGWQVVQG